MDALVAQQFGLQAGQGLLVTHVEDEGPASAVNLETGHVIAALDGQSTPDLLSAALVLGPKEAGAETSLTVLVERRRGPFSQVQQARVRVRVR